MRTKHIWICTYLSLTAAVRRQYCRCTLQSAGGCRNGKLQNVSPPSVLFESSRIFLQYTGDTDTKNDGPEFLNSNSVIFENFLKFSKRRRAVPLRSFWAIMDAAKLDQSRVVVTKFRQNRLTLKGRSAGQRHTHRQTRLKIMALQVCNRANRPRYSVGNNRPHLRTYYARHGLIITMSVYYPFHPKPQ